MTTARPVRRLPAWVVLFARLVVVLLMTVSLLETASFGCGTACDDEVASAELAAGDDLEIPSVVVAGDCGDEHEGDCSCPCQCPGGCSSSCRVLAALPATSRLPSPPVAESGYQHKDESRPPDADPVGILHVPRVSAA